METLYIKKALVGGDFSEVVSLEPKTKPLLKMERRSGEGLERYWMEISVGGEEYIIPDDLRSYTFEYSPRESTSIAKSLLKWGLAAASAELALGGTRGSGIGKGAASVLLGKAALRTNSTKIKGYVISTLQFSDHKILTFELKTADWTKFDEEISVLTFPEVDNEFQQTKALLKDELTLIRENFASLPKKEKKEATSRIKEVEEGIQTHEKQHAKRRKIFKSRTSTSPWALFKHYFQLALGILILIFLVKLAYDFIVYVMK